MDYCTLAAGLTPEWIAIGALIVSVVGGAGGLGYKLGCIAQRQNDHERGRSERRRQCEDRRAEDLAAMSACRAERGAVEHDLFERLGGMQEQQAAVAQTIGRVEGQLKTLCRTGGE